MQRQPPNRIVQARNQAKISLAERDRELQCSQAAHAQAEAKLKAELQRRQATLTSCKAEVDRLQTEVQSLQGSQQAAQHGKAEQMKASQAEVQSSKDMVAVMLKSLAIMCRLTLRSTAAMRAGGPALRMQIELQTA
jgi:septal ring factor EnvC (AmiA/AmiB activator)